MSTDASNVEDINIFQIKEFLSVSCMAFFEDWFNIFRNRSLTLCKNDRDFNVMSDSVAVSESMSSSSMTNLSVRWVNGCPPTGLPVLASNISSVSTHEKTTFRQYFILSCLMSLAPITGHPIIYWMLLSPRAQRYLTFRCGFRLAF